MKTLSMVVAGLLMAAFLSTGLVQPAFAKDKKEKTASARIEKDKKVSLEYKLTVDGTVVDQSAPDKLFQYTHGNNMIIKGLEVALEGMKVGDTKKVTVESKDAYGDVRQEGFFKFPKSKIPEGTDLKKGQVITLMNTEKKPIKAVVWGFEGEEIVLNANHPLAGKTLNFDIKVMSIE